MAGAALSTPELLFYFPAESIASLTRRWQDWVSRGATVATRKDQAQDCPGTRFELLRTHILLRPVMTAAVAIAEPRLDRANSVEDGAGRGGRLKGGPNSPGRTTGSRGSSTRSSCGCCCARCSPRPAARTTTGRNTTG